MFTIPTTQLRTAFSRLFHHPIAKQRPQAIVAGNTLLMPSATVWQHELYRNGQTVWLFGSQRHKVLSLRQESIDANNHDHEAVFCYRANVMDTHTNRARFVDLAPQQLLRVG